MDESLKKEIDQRPALLETLSGPDQEEANLYAVSRAWNNLKYIKNPSKEVREKALLQKGWAIQYISEPTLEEELLAVSQDADAINYIESPSCQVQVKAVKRAWNAIRYIKEPCREAALLAVAANEQAISYLTDLDEEALSSYLKVNLNILKYIYDSVDEDLLQGVLLDLFEGEPSERTVAQFMDLAVLDLDKMAFIARHGSKKSRQLVMDYVLEG